MREKQPDEVKELNKQLGALMWEARRYKGETVKRCAEEFLGITRQRYDLMERGEANIGWAEFKHVMESLNIPDEWLLPRMRDRGLLLGLPIQLDEARSTASESPTDQQGTAAGETIANTTQQQEHVSNGLPAPALGLSASVVSRPSSVPPRPSFTADHMLLPLVSGYGYIVQMVDPDGAVVYNFDWGLPGRKRIRTAKLRSVGGTQSQKSAAASL